MKNRFRPLVCSVALAMLALVTVSAQTTAPAALPSGASPGPQALVADLHWRNVGPAVMGGRIDDIVADPANPAVIYIGAASGGVWKTVNAGTTWTPIFDDDGTTSIGDLALAPSNPQIVWVGTGEANNRQSSSWGNGIYKSTDGGKTWTHMGLDDTRHIGRIVIDPHNPDIVYVAALGHLWGPNKARGLYKTTDGGKTWTNTRFIDEDTGFVDIVMDPSNSRVLYAAAYQRRRTPWGFDGGGPGSGLYKTTDAGRTWTKLTNGLPSGDTGRIGLAIYPKNPKVLYASVENADGGLFRTDDAGRTWKRVNKLNVRPPYFSNVRVDPQNDQRVYMLASPLYVSDDGGKTFRSDGARNVHVDHHAMWIDPRNPAHVMLGNDGGFWMSWDHAVTWRRFNNIPLGQIYVVSADNSDPYRLYAGLQDNGVWEGPSATRHRVGPLNDDWIQVDGGDGMYVTADPEDPSTAYIEMQDGRLMRFNYQSGEVKSIDPWVKDAPEAGDFGKGPARLRFNWTTPVVVSPHNHLTIYLAGNRLWKSLDRGETWQPISPDLSRAIDRDKLPIMGVVPTEHTLSLNDGVTSYGNATTMMESPVTPGLMLVGMDDGNVQMTTDGGASWTNISTRFPGLPDGAAPSRVVLSNFDARRMYATFDNHRKDDYAAYVYTSEDGGATWRAIASGLPPVSVRTIAEDPRNPDLLFLGTENGVWYSLDRGQAWNRLKNNLPDVPVPDIAIQPRDHDLILGTHGRSIYIMNIAPLEALDETTRAEAAHLFEPRPATSFNYLEHRDFLAQAEYVGANPPYGATLDYYIENAGPDVTLTVTGPDGDVVRELKGPGAAGIHRVIWDLRYPPPPFTPRPATPGIDSKARPSEATLARVPGDYGGGGDITGGESGGQPNLPTGPTVLPGRYTVTLKAGGATSRATLRVDLDPRVEITERDLLAQHRFLMASYRAQLAGGEATSAGSALRDGIDAITKALGAEKTPPEALKRAADDFAKKVRGLQRDLGRAAGRVGGLGRSVSRSTSRPTAAQEADLADALADLSAAVSALNQAIATDVPAINRQLDGAGMAASVPRLRAPDRVKWTASKK
ncbi:MAG TPA: hypothetical protein VFK20_06325 [Vicinamibacterales bacterium]|nr:hypothetical protein [Vicinamibacterales bacterium]